MFNYLIKTVKGSVAGNSPEEAIQTAINFIFDFISDGIPAENWWVIIQDMRDDSSFYLSCPEIGKWSYSGAEWGRKIMEGR